MLKYGRLSGEIEMGQTFISVEKKTRERGQKSVLIVL